MKKRTILFIAVLFILAVLTPEVKANAGWHIAMKSAYKNGYETVTAKNTVYGASGDTVAVFEGLTSNTKVISAKSNNKDVKASVFYYTYQGKKQYSILAKCSTITKESATITVKCYSKKKKKNYTRILTVKFNPEYNYGLDNLVSVQKGNNTNISMQRYSQILSQSIKLKKFHEYIFFYDDAKSDHICDVSLNKEKAVLSIQATQTGSLRMQIKTKYKDGEILGTNIILNVTDAEGFIVNKDQSVVMGDIVYHCFGLADSNAKLTVTNSDDSVLQYHLQIKTAKEIAKAYGYPLSSFDDPNARVVFLYFEGLKTGKSKMDINYTLTSNGETVAYQYRYNFEVLDASQKKTSQVITFATYENSNLYTDPCYLEDSSGNLLQRTTDFSKISITDDNLYTYYETDGLTKLKMKTPEDNDVTVIIRDLENREIFRYTKTIKVETRVETEPAEFLFKKDSEAKTFFTKDNGRWYAENLDCISFQDNKISAYNSDNMIKIKLSKDGPQLSKNAAYSINASKKTIHVTDGSYTVDLPYRIISSDKIIIQMNGKWIYFAKNVEV